MDRKNEEVSALKQYIEGIPYMKYFNKLDSAIRTGYLKCCWLEQYEPKRVLVMQYQMPNSFYFILSGTLVCTYKSNEERKSSTICLLHRGQTKLINKC